MWKHLENKSHFGDDVIKNKCFEIFKEASGTKDMKVYQDYVLCKCIPVNFGLLDLSSPQPPALLYGPHILITFITFLQIKACSLIYFLNIWNNFRPKKTKNVCVWGDMLKKIRVDWKDFFNFLLNYFFPVLRAYGTLKQNHVKF